MSALHRSSFTSLSTVGLGLGLTFGLTASFTLAGCQQPRPYCSTAHGDFAATYKLTKGDPMSACGQRTGDVLGLQTYYATGGLNGTPKFSDSSMAIIPGHLGNLRAKAAKYDPPIADPNSDHTPVALADFTTSLPSDDEFCEAPKFSVAELSLPELPLIPAVPDDPETPDKDESAAEIPAVPASDIRYEWSNARVLVSANYQGTQLSAHLKLTQDDCTAEYDVLGVYPLATCEADADCQITAETGINPDFDLKCQTDLGFCVITGELPALK